MKSLIFSRCASLICAAAFVAGCQPTTSTQTSAPLASGSAAAIQFVDVTKQAGIAFKHTTGAFGAKLMPESVGSGVVFIDYDGDGYQDVYFVNSRQWNDAELAPWKNAPWSKAEMGYFHTLHPGKPLVRDVPANRPKNRVTGLLYHNNRNGTFSDATKQAGLDVELFGMGASVGDYDNDGKDDLYVTAWQRSYLFHNEGGRFRDVTAQAGVASPGWGTSAAWVDYDKDGRLDLFVCHYVVWTPATDVFYSPHGAIKSYVGPRFYTGEPSHLYHNDGNGKFSDVSAKAGISGYKPGEAPGKGLGVALCDVNDDDWPDLMVTNDMVANFLYENQKNGTFKEVAALRGVALSAGGNPRAGMGVDAAELDGSGAQTIVVGNFSRQMLGLYQNRDGVFHDVANEAGLGQASFEFLTFGLSFLDYDNDGLLDIFVANGHVQDDIADINEGLEYAERPLLFHNESGLKFKETGLASGAAMAQKTVARGMAYADFDLDGDPDVAISTCGFAATLLRNDGGANRALRVQLQGTKSNRNGIGAKIEAKIGAATVRRVVKSGSSYCSANEIPVTLGLGQNDKVQTLTIRWPSGAVTTLNDVAANQSILVREGAGIVKQQALRRS